MSTRCSVYFKDGYHLWEEALEGPKYGLLLSGYQKEDDNIEELDFERVRLPLPILKAAAEWYERNKERLQ